MVEAGRGEWNNSAVQQLVPLGLTLLPVEKVSETDGCDRALHGSEFAVLAIAPGTRISPEPPQIAPVRDLCTRDAFILLR
jgi:hypothetical protein